MSLAITFPHPADVIADEAARNREMTITQRLDKLLMLCDFGHAHLGARFLESHRQQKQVSETEWQNVQAQVFAHHAK